MFGSRDHKRISSLVSNPAFVFGYVGHTGVRVPSRLDIKLGFSSVAAFFSRAPPLPSNSEIVSATSNILQSMCFVGVSYTARFDLGFDWFY
ncbi:hypothetical protein MtrunA17_Chr8g0362811 [Medicago truncatula]|uniref:Uncharacterized protein n=1 Tax=Medicago truncatula TaxID=3880 RepID=A0A396GQZ1_MEDTR|nr:hypothetical protein MtrunA17_Chr8g0362811 [Medicago truncatula]